MWLLGHVLGNSWELRLISLGAQSHAWTLRYLRAQVWDGFVCDGEPNSLAGPEAIGYDLALLAPPGISCP